MGAYDHLRKRITMLCQGCGCIHVETWPYLTRCPRCEGAVHSHTSGYITSEMFDAQAAMMAEDRKQVGCCRLPNEATPEELRRSSVSVFRGC